MSFDRSGFAELLHVARHLRRLTSHPCLVLYTLLLRLLLQL